MKFSLRAAAALVLFGASGCSAGLHSSAPSPQTYLLKVMEPPAREDQGTQQQPKASIQISRPQARPGLDTDRIAIVKPGHKGDYYASAQWAGAVPDVVESLLIDRLRASRRWTVVQSSRNAFPADYLLQVRVSSFDAEYTDEKSAPRVTVAMDCTIGRRVDREMLAAFSVTGTALADANRLGAVAAAFETAANAALDQLDAQSWAAVKTSQAP